MNLKMISTALVAVLVSIGVAAAQNRAAKPADAVKGQVTQSSRSQFFSWAKVRLDEIDATLASWEAEAAKLRGEARAKAENALANMRAKRDAFRETIQKETEQIESDWNRAKAAREADWKAFEASAQKFIDDASTQVEQQKAAFQARADAQTKAWQQAMEKLQQDATKVAAENKSKAEAAVKQMKADAAAAQAKLEKLKSAGASSWSAYEKALDETRAAFDHANQSAQEAFAK